MNSKNLDYFSKLLSILPFYYFIYLGFSNFFTLTFGKNKDFKIIFLYTLGIITSTLLTEIVKKFVNPNKYFKKYWYRPKGAKGCDYLSVSGYTPEYTPGFPSGHMATTAFFVFYNLIQTYNLTNKDNITKIFYNTSNISLLALMGWARMYKRCHSLVQVIAGTVVGGITASIFYYLKLNI